MEGVISRAAGAPQQFIAGLTPPFEVISSNCGAPTTNEWTASATALTTSRVPVPAVLRSMSARIGYGSIEDMTKGLSSGRYNALIMGLGVPVPTVRNWKRPSRC